MLSTHAQKLERWLGAGEVEHLSNTMRGWYGPPILVGNTPDGSKIYATGDGDFVGLIRGGGYASLLDHCETRVKKILTKWSNKQANQLNAGFTSLSDLIAEATVGGKRNEYQFNKAGTTGVASSANSLWRVGNQPAAGAAAAAAPGGTAPTMTTTGAVITLANPTTGGDTRHLVQGTAMSTAAPNCLLMYDRIFAVAKTMNSTATEAVTGVPSRYQSTVANDADSAAGNFLFMECGTVLPATAHNWTTCTYTDQSGNTGATLPSVTGNSANIVNRLDMPIGAWWARLASGDSGIKALTQMQCSAAVATGAIDFVIGHPLILMPTYIANAVSMIDGINTAFNLTRIFDDACIAFLEINKPTTTATTYAGTFTTVDG